METTSCIHFWGKADSVGGRWTPLVHHMLDVASVAREVAKATPGFIREWTDRLGLSETIFLDVISFLGAFHDLGKFAADFQGKVPELYALLSEKEELPEQEEPHPASAWLFWNNYLRDFLFDHLNLSIRKLRFNRIAEPLLSASFAHHGSPVASSVPDHKFRRIYGDREKEAASLLLKELLELFPGVVYFFRDLERFYKNEKEAVLHAFSFPLSGLIILSDWTASSPHNFPVTFSMNERPSESSSVHADLIKYNNHSQDMARTAIEKQGLIPVASRIITDPWREIFSELAKEGYGPSPLQRTVLERTLPEEPALYILEDVAGSGKTEAALILTARLLARGEGEGGWCRWMKGRGNAICYP